MLKNYSPHAAIVCPQCRNVAPPDALICALCGFHFRVQWNTRPAKKQSSPIDKMLNTIVIGAASLAGFLILCLFLGSLLPHTSQPTLVGHWIQYIDGRKASMELIFNADKSGMKITRRGQQVLTWLRFDWSDYDGSKGDMTFYADNQQAPYAAGRWEMDGVTLRFTFAVRGLMPGPTNTFNAFKSADQNWDYPVPIGDPSAQHDLASVWRYSKVSDDIREIEINPRGQGIMTTITSVSAANDKVVPFRWQKTTENEDEVALFASSPGGRETPIAYLVKKNGILLVEIIGESGEREPSRTFTWVAAPFKHTLEGQ